jgi:predicted phage tail protein
MQYWINGTIVPVQDREKDPVYQFTDANVIGGSFEYEGSARKTRHNMVKVTYNNPDNFHKQTIEYVQDAELLAKEGSFPQIKNITAFGCTSRGQALRLGKWVLASEKLNYETVKFKTGLNASFLRPGDIVNVLDARRQGVGWAGRVLKPTTTSQLVTNGTFGSGISSWTQGTATQSHDTSKQRIKLTSGGSAQTPRS